VDHKKLSDILYKVADFRQPKVQERGYFQLKPEWWTEFDPLFAQFYPNELEDAQERAGHVGKQQFYWRIGSPHKATPPYNRLTNLLHTQECHQLLWNVLNHVKILVNDNKTSTAGEALGVTALQMMEIALRDRLLYQPSSAALQPSGLHLNDILVNIKLSPCTYPGRVVGGSSTWKLGSSSMYDLLQEFQSLTNAHRLADYAQYTLDLLHSSFPIYFGADFRGSKLKKSPEYQASIVEDERQRLKKERQAALLAKFSAQQKAFLEQHGDHEEEDDEHRYDDAGPTDGSHAGSEAGGNFERISGKAPAVVTLTETTFGIQECAFCRRKCDSSDSPAGWIAFMQCYNMPRQVLKKERAQRVKILEEAESIAKGDDTKQLVTLIEPQNLDLGVCDFRGGSLDYYPTEHVACCGHQMHQACFDSYVSNLGHQHHQGNSYEGVSQAWCNRCLLSHLMCLQHCVISGDGLGWVLRFDV
jgi:E3 ubiquitin-protein ligase UBR1/E3 ubiquitin-protein ligase UBR3